MNSIKIELNIKDIEVSYDMYLDEPTYFIFVKKKVYEENEYDDDDEFDDDDYEEYELYRNEYDSKAHVKMINYWLLNSRGIRRFGSAALDLCSVAAGRFHVYYESMLNPWDLAAGALT